MNKTKINQMEINSPDTMTDSTELTPEKKRVYCFDIDGTLCTNTEGAYETAEPFTDVIVEVNRLYDAGHTLLLMTARGWTTGIDWRELTEKQMQQWGVKYHRLIMGKPTADIYIDDKAINADAWRLSSFGLTLSAAKGKT